MFLLKKLAILIFVLILLLGCENDKVVKIYSKIKNPIFTSEDTFIIANTLYHKLDENDLKLFKENNPQMVNYSFEGNSLFIQCEEDTAKLCLNDSITMGSLSKYASDTSNAFKDTLVYTFLDSGYIQTRVFKYSPYDCTRVVMPSPFDKWGTKYIDDLYYNWTDVTTTEKDSVGTDQ